jgi:hypothetical protein
MEEIRKLNEEELEMVTGGAVAEEWDVPLFLVLDVEPDSDSSK